MGEVCGEVVVVCEMTWCLGSGTCIQKPAQISHSPDETDQTKSQDEY